MPPFLGFSNPSTPQQKRRVSPPKIPILPTRPALEPGAPPVKVNLPNRRDGSGEEAACAWASVCGFVVTESSEKKPHPFSYLLSSSLPSESLPPLSPWPLPPWSVAQHTHPREPILLPPFQSTCTNRRRPRPATPRLPPAPRGSRFDSNLGTQRSGSGSGGGGGGGDEQEQGEAVRRPAQGLQARQVVSLPACPRSSRPR